MSDSKKIFSYSLFIYWALSVFPIIIFFTQKDLSDFVLELFAITFIFYLFNKKIFIPKTLLFTFFATLAFLVLHLLSYWLYGLGNYYHGYYYRLTLIIPITCLLLKYEVDIEKVNYSIIITILFSFILAIYQVGYLHVARAGIPFMLNHAYQPVNWGDMLILFSVYLLYYFLYYSPKMPIVYLLAIVLGLSCSILSGSRGGWLGLPFVGIMIICSLTKSWPKRILMIFSFSVVSGALLIIACKYNIFRVGEAYENLQTCFLKNQCIYDPMAGENSLGLRVLMFKNAYQAFKANPLFGVGVGAYTNYIIQLARNGLILPYFQFHFNEEPHNEFIRVLSMLGIVGALNYILIMLGPVLAIRHNRKAMEVLAGVIIVFFCAALSQALLVAPLACNSFVFMVALLLYRGLSIENKVK